MMMTSKRKGSIASLRSKVAMCWLASSAFLASVYQVRSTVDAFRIAFIVQGAYSM